jgi:hypothetical protein
MPPAPPLLPRPAVAGGAFGAAGRQVGSLTALVNARRFVFLTANSQTQIPVGRKLGRDPFRYFASPTGKGRAREWTPSCYFNTGYWVLGAGD